MNDFANVLGAAVIGLALAAGPTGTGDARAQGVVERDSRFEIRPREADALSFDLNAAGAIEVTAKWDGAPGQLTLSLIAPDSPPPAVTRTGASPLVVRFVANADALKRGVNWQARVEGPVMAPVTGTLHLRVPAGAPRQDAFPLRSGTVLLNESTSRDFVSFSKAIRAIRPDFRKMVTGVAPQSLNVQAVAGELGNRLVDESRRAGVISVRPELLNRFVVGAVSDAASDSPVTAPTRPPAAAEPLQRQALIKLARLPTAADRTTLSDRGITLVDYLGGKVFRAVVTPTGDAEEDITAAPVAAIRQVEAGSKIEPRIALGQFSRFVASPPSAAAGAAPVPYVLNADGTVNLTVQFVSTAPRARMERVLGGLTTARQPLSDSDWRVTMSPDSIRMLAADETVKWIEAAPAPGSPDNDRTRSLLKIDPLQGLRPSIDPPAFDLAGGGDADLLIGADDGRIRLALNSGTEDHPAFNAPVGLLSGAVPLGVVGRGVPAVCDADNDGDLDLHVGGADGRVLRFLNVGTDATPVYGPGVPVPAGGAEIDVGDLAAPMFWDCDGDGRKDLLVGNAAGLVLLFRNNGPDTAPAFGAGVPLKSAGADLDVGAEAVPTAYDLNSDGRQDLVVGNSEGQVLAFLASGSGGISSFSAAIPLATGGTLIDVGDGAAPTFHDLDGDRADDLVIGNAAGDLRWFARLHGATTGRLPDFAAAAALPGPAGLHVEGHAVPRFHDMDLDGVRIANAESGTADWRHADFEGRVVCRADSLPPGGSVLNDHTTHVVGTMAGAGTRSDARDVNGSPNGGLAFQWRGLAPQAGILFLHDVKTEQDLYRAINVFGAGLVNGSYSVSYDGDYDTANKTGDRVVRGDGVFQGLAIPPTTLVYSSGNHAQFPLTGGVQIGYFSLTKQFKNVIVVGNWDDAGGRGLFDTSSLGPTHDGRIKPDLVAPGAAVVSSLQGEHLDGYGPKNGTSMSSAAVSGTVALLLDAYRRAYGRSFGQVRPLPSSVRAVLIQTADDVDWVGHAPTGRSNPGRTNDDGPVSYLPGPDFATGWGLINPAGALRAIRTRSIGEAMIRDNGQVREFSFETGDASDVRVTLAWDDPAADPSLPLTEPHLVNDLDLELVDPAGQVHYPFALDQKIVSASDPTIILTPEEQTPGVEVKVQRTIVPVLDPSAQGIDYPHHDIPIAPALRGRDHLNNVEQVLAPGKAGKWVIRVTGFALPVIPQRFSVAAPLGADHEPPVFAGPTAVTLAATKPEGLPTDGLTPSGLNLAVEDFRDPATAVSHDAPPVLPVGKTTVTFNATDAAGNSATFPVDVTITPFGR